MAGDGKWVEYTIKYVYGSYDGTYRVLLSPTEIDYGIDPRDKMWGELRREGHLSLGMATKSAKILDSRVLED